MGSNLPEPGASLVFPPEILDDILEHIPADRHGRPTLLACALVATWWTGPSQRRLFSSVSICDGNYHRWMYGVVGSRSKTHLLRYVRSLTHSLGLKKGTRYPMQNLPRDSGEYLSALHNINSLSLQNITSKHTGEEIFRACFSGFRDTLTKLSLGRITAPFSTFVALVGHFPNLTTLRLSPFKLKPDEGPVPPLTRPLRGNIYIHDVGSDCLAFINRLAGLDLEYDGLVIETVSLVDGEVLDSMLQLSASTIKYLRLDAVLGETVVSISHFRQLREFDLYVNWTSPVHEGIISSITSKDLRKIIFPVHPDPVWNIISQGTEMWDPIDKELCELVARMGYPHKLEVELRPTKIGYDIRKYDLTRFLTEFRKNGVLTIRDDDPDWSP